MPEFIMHGRDGMDFKAEDPFVQGFTEAMFFTECSPMYSADEWFTPECEKAQEEGKADGSLPSDAGYDDLSPGALEAVRRFCTIKYGQMRSLLSEAYERGYTPTQAGRDLWFTFNGHGVGYWDRNVLRPGGLGEALSDACGDGEINPFCYYKTAAECHAEKGRLVVSLTIDERAKS